MFEEINGIMLQRKSLNNGSFELVRLDLNLTCGIYPESYSIKRAFMQYLSNK